MCRHAFHQEKNLRMAAAQDVLGPPPVLESIFDDFIAAPPTESFKRMTAEEAIPAPQGGSSHWLVRPSYLDIQQESVDRDVHIYIYNIYI